LTSFVAMMNWSIMTLTNHALDVMDRAIYICDDMEKSIKYVTNFVVESKSITTDIENKVNNSK